MKRLTLEFTRRALNFDTAKFSMRGTLTRGRVHGVVL